MKLSDFKTVEKLKNIRERLLAAKVDVEKYIDSIHEKGADVGGTVGFEEGYYCMIGTHTDGSGPTINLIGCYIAESVAEASREIIDEKLYDVIDQLNRYGVEVDLSDSLAKR